MDLHIVPGISAKDAALAHYEDLKIQENYGCKCITYWVDEARDSAFCLIEAPDKESVIQMHQKAHGLIPYEIIQVNSQIVDAFLGRIQDPHLFSDLLNPELSFFSDPAFRILLICKTLDFQLLKIQYGESKSSEMIKIYKDTLTSLVNIHEGNEVNLGREFRLASFVSVNEAVNCATAVSEALYDLKDALNFKLALHAGTPVENNNSIFGSIIQFAEDLCTIATDRHIVFSTLIKELCLEKGTAMTNEKKIVRCLSLDEEQVLIALMKVLRGQWKDPHFNAIHLCKHIGMSKSNLFRKCKSLTGLSPNILIKDYRLAQSLSILTKSRCVSQTAFDCGFSSASYYAKCFHKQYGVQPNAIIKANV